MKNDKGQKMTVSAPDGRPVAVRLEVNPRARRLILRLDESTREAVAIAPNRRQLKAAAAFAVDRAGWIADRLDDLPRSAPIEDGATIPFRGAPCLLTSEGEGRLARFEPGPPACIRSPGAPETFERRTIRFLKKEAKADLAAAVARHCDTLGVKASAIQIKDTRSRWGSCTADGRLSFSWRLICAPPEVLDYVAAHECAHLIEMNHSPAFWAQVSKICPDWKRQRAWLRGEGRGLHAVGAGTR
ncbi:MAG: SprT family zinc-dependent metalloprotease [Pseudomonadota bacterium]